MDLVEHLAELRKRLIVVVIALAVSFAITYSYSEEIYRILSAPLFDALPKGYEYMAFIGVVEPFYTYLKAALVGAVLLSSPVIFFEVWAFAAPGLYKNERRWFLPIVFVSVLLFSAGVVFAHQVVFPVGFAFLLGFIGDELKPMLSVASYFSFSTETSYSLWRSIRTATLCIGSFKDWRGRRAQAHPLVEVRAYHKRCHRGATNSSRRL